MRWWRVEETTVCEESSGAADGQEAPRFPPILPPPLPFGPGSPLGGGRLHQFTLFIAAFRAIKGLALPAAVVLFSGGGRSVGLLLLVVLAMALVVAAVRYFTFTYSIEGGDLITRQGLFSRRERQIPLVRVQDLRIEAGPLHRLLGVVDVHVETAGGEGIEAELSVLDRKMAEELRQAIFERTGRSTADRVDSGELGETLGALRLSDLVIEGLTSNRAASIFVVMGAAVGLIDSVMPRSVQQQWIERLGRGATLWFSEANPARWQELGLAGLAVLLLSMVFSIGGSILLFHGFTLVRRGDDLYRTYGLLTRRASSLPRRRLQVVQITEPWLRRIFGLAAVRADTAAHRSGGDEEKQGGRDVLLPLVRRRALGDLIQVFLPDAGPEPERWERVDRCAIRRATFKATIVCLFLVLAALLGPFRETAWPAWLHAFWPLALLPVLHWIHRRQYAHLGYAEGITAFRTRRGWLSRATHIVPTRNLQVVVLRQTPFDRRHGVWTLKLDTAGQAFTGGGPMLRNVAGAEAWRLGRALAGRAARTQYRV
jgi:putative membrane protein